MTQLKNPKTDGHEDLQSLFLDEDGEFQEDISGVRTLDVGHRHFIMKASDPYGLWSIHMKGPTPKVLEGSYTSPVEAEKAIHAYCNAATAK